MKRSGYRAPEALPRQVSAHQHGEDCTKVAIRSTADATQPFGSFLRPLWLGEELARRGHTVTHYCPAPPRSEGLQATYIPIRGGQGIVTWEGIKEEPSNLRRLEATHPDVLYVHRTVNLGFFLPRLMRTYPTVLDAHGSEYMEYRAFGQIEKARRARLVEALTLSIADRVVAASPELREFLTAEYDLDPALVSVVPNGIPEAVLRKPPSASDWRNRLGLAGYELLVVTAAPGPYAANDLSLAFLEEVAAAARVDALPIRLVVTGRSAAPPGITPMGVVEDYLGLIDAADATLLPYPPAAVCGGARNKTLEFMARGKPIVSTKEGMRGVPDAKPSVHYMLAETPPDMVAAIAELRENPDHAQNLGRSAKELASRYLWSESAVQLDQVLRACLEGA